MLRPLKGGSGHRRYRRKDVETALEIKRLLYQQCFTIAGARSQLMKSKGVSDRAAAPRKGRQSILPFDDVPRSTLRRIRRELDEILTILAKT